VGASRTKVDDSPTITVTPAIVGAVLLRTLMGRGGGGGGEGGGLRRSDEERLADLNEISGR
jgi:hypothetical protein